MAAVRLSRLQKYIVRWLAADEKRTRGRITSSHLELVAALPKAQGNMSHSLHRLEPQGLLVMTRTRGGKTESVSLTAAGAAGRVRRPADLREVMNKEERRRKTTRCGPLHWREARRCPVSEGTPASAQATRRRIIAHGETARGGGTPLVRYQPNSIGQTL